MEDYRNFGSGCAGNRSRKTAVRRFQERIDDHFLVALASTQRHDPAAGYRLAESTAEIQAAELLLYDAAARLDQLGGVGKLIRCSMLSIIRDCGWGVRLLARAVDSSTRRAARTQCGKTEPIQRIWRCECRPLACNFDLGPRRQHVQQGVTRKHLVVRV